MLNRNAQRVFLGFGPEVRQGYERPDTNGDFDAFCHCLNLYILEQIHKYA